MFQVGNRVKAKNGNSLFSSGRVQEVEQGDWMLVDFDADPILFYLGTCAITGKNPCLVVKDTFEVEEDNDR